jgi:hypothetical protein
MLQTSISRKRKILDPVLLSCFASLLLGAAVAGGRAPENESALPSDEPTASQKSKFDCLPNDVRLDDVVSHSKTTKGNVTVEKTLIQMKAQCRNRKLVDAKRREIRFFRLSCWGNPPADYLEIQQRENSELQKLKRTYSVIVFTCDPMIQ